MIDTISNDLVCILFFFFNDTATTEIYTLSLHDALPIADSARRPIGPDTGAGGEGERQLDRARNSVGRSFRLGQQALEIQRPRRHGDGAVGGPGPFALWSVAVQLDAVAVGVPQVDRFADAVVGCSFERHSGIEHAAHSPGEGLAVRVENREVVQTRRAPGRCGGPTPRPRVEPDVVMVASRREKHGVPPVATRDFKAEDVTVEGEGAVQIRHPEVHVTDAGAGGNGHQSMNVREFHDVMTLCCKWLCYIRTT